MASSTCYFSFSLFAFPLVFTGREAVSSNSRSAQLSENFYSESCPKVFSSVKSVVQSAVSKERLIGASLLRLFFHDCFVQGCDGSILLDNSIDSTQFILSEKDANPNHNSVRGYEVIDDIKSKVEETCPGVVSCADIVAIAARDSIVILGGPSWDVRLGRRDSKKASFFGANSVLPPPTSTLSELIKKFKYKGLSIKDLVALSGSHTIGQAKCSSFNTRIKETNNIDSSFAETLQEKCNLGNDTLAPLDLQTPTAFDNNYFKNLIKKKGLLYSDQVLFDGGSTYSLVKTYSDDAETFNSDFAAAMIKMGNIRPLTGSHGQIRKNCRKVN